MVFLLQAGDAFRVNLLAQRLLANFQQCPGVVMNELRMALEAQHLIVDVVRGKRAEIAGGDHRGVFRQ
ncbi:hypothetical protein D3C81_1975570 [compost metagenome]